MNNLDRTIIDYLAKRPDGSPESWISHSLGGQTISATLRELERRGLIRDARPHGGQQPLWKAV